MEAWFLTCLAFIGDLQSKTWYTPLAGAAGTGETDHMSRKIRLREKVSPGQAVQGAPAAKKPTTSPPPTLIAAKMESTGNAAVKGGPSDMHVGFVLHGCGWQVSCNLSIVPASEV